MPQGHVGDTAVPAKQEKDKPAEDLSARGSGLLRKEPPPKRPSGVTVPRSREKPSVALRIDGFVRPLHEKHVQELLSNTGGFILWG